MCCVARPPICIQHKNIKRDRIFCWQQFEKQIISFYRSSSSSSSKRQRKQREVKSNENENGKKKIKWRKRWRKWMKAIQLMICQWVIAGVYVALSTHQSDPNRRLRFQLALIVYAPFRFSKDLHMTLIASLKQELCWERYRLRLCVFDF